MRVRGPRTLWVPTLGLAVGLAACSSAPRMSGMGGRLAAAATSTTIEIPALPRSPEEFVTLRNDLAQKPAGGAAMMVVALIVYAQDAKLGEKLITIAVEQRWLQADGQGYQGYSLGRADQQRIRDQVGVRPYIAYSYVAGTSPEGGYALPAGPLSIEITEVRDEGDGSTKVFVRSTGADSPRPIRLRPNDKGIWKASEWSSVLVDVRRPTTKQDDPL